MKKTFLSFALGLCAMTSYAQAPFTLEGVAGSEVTEVYVSDMSNRRAKTDTIQVVGGKFSLKGENDGLKFVTLTTNANPTSSLAIVLDGNVKVDLKTRTVSGSEENVKLSQHWKTVEEKKQEILALSMDLRNLQEEYKKKGIERLPEDVYAPFWAKYDSISSILNALAKKVCLENLNSYFPAALLINAQLNNSDWVEIAQKKSVCLQLPMFARINSYIEGWRRQEVGQPFTDLEMADTTGAPRKLSEFVGKGKYVLVDFWASWCGPCRQEMPEVKALYDKYHDRGFDIVGVSFDNNKKAWVECINSLGLSWNHISDLKGWKCAASTVYGINSIPATLLIGPDGKIVAAGLRAQALAEKLAELFP